MQEQYNQDIQQNRQEHLKLINELRRRSSINVIFIVSSLSMWQHQNVYELMAANKHFNTSIIFVPFTTFSKEENELALEQLKGYFAKHSTPFYVYQELDFGQQTFRERFAPDVLFYPQWYSGNYDANIDISSFFDRLICLIPYGITTIGTKDNYDCDGNNYAWKQYQTSPIHKEDAKRLSRCKGDNVVVVGYPKGDKLLSTISFDPWKKQECSKKRVIWAPHFTISDGITFLHRSNFLMMSEFMWSLAERYKGTVQFAFKPHPRLKTELYKHPEWGKERTDHYYQRWETGSNTQLETGDYIELFKTSDAMIHDCGSFSVEYLYLRKPVMFITNSLEKTKETEALSDFGCRALDMHYVGFSESSINRFIENVVMLGQDDMKKKRDCFFNEYLFRDEHKTSSELIYQDICNELWVRDSVVDANKIKKDQPLVSIIIPCYNQALYIAEALDSVLAQTYQNWEAFVIDDGSTDNLAAVVKPFLKKSQHIHYYYQSNGGVSKARNIGVKMSQGKYILPLDGDDVISPFYIERAVSYLEKNPECTLYYCQVDFFDEVNEHWPVAYKDYKNLLLYNSIFCSSVFRRADFDRVGGYDETFLLGLEDWEFYIRLLSSGGQVYQASDVLFLYRRHSSQAVSRNDTANNLRENEILEDIYLKNKKSYTRYFPIYIKCLRERAHLSECLKGEQLVQNHLNQQIASLQEQIASYKETNNSLEQNNKRMQLYFSCKPIKILYKIIRAYRKHVKKAELY